MKPAMLVLASLLATPAYAQSTIHDAMAKEAAQYAAYHAHETHMRSRTLFWVGLGAVAAGTTLMIAASTWAQTSDLTFEDPATRLGRDLAPCGTDATTTDLPIADCQINKGLFVIGGSVALAGGAMMVLGAWTVTPSLGHRPMLAYRVRF